MSEILIQKQLLITAAFLAGILIFLWAFRKLSINTKYGKKGLIHVVSAIALGNKEKLLLVQVQGKKILLGMTAASIDSLHVFDESENKA